MHCPRDIEISTLHVCTLEKQFLYIAKVEVQKTKTTITGMRYMIESENMNSANKR